MQVTRLIAAAIGLLFFISSPRAVSQLFRNLNFEQAVLTYTQGSDFLLEPTNAVPGWQTSTAYISHNGSSLGAAWITIHDTNSIWAQPLEGRYALNFQRSYPSGKETPWISQVGFVSTAAKSLRFLSNWDGMEVTFDGEPLEIVPISDKLWGADIARFAGHTGELKFSGAGVLDGIRFSTLEIPEPSSFMLLAAGGGMLWCMRRRRGRP